MERHPRYLSCLALGAAGVMVMAACGSSSKKSTAAGGTTGTTAAAKYPPIPAGPIKFGVSTPLTGATAAFGTATKAAFENVTLKTFNAAHPDGIDGHQVQIEILDDASDVTKAVNVANQFVSEKITAVLTATYNPAAAPQQLAIFGKAKIPALVQAVSDDYTDTSKWPYFFGMGSSDKQAGEAAAKYIGKHSEIKKISILSDGSPSQVEIQNDMMTALKTSAPSVTVAKTATITPGAVDVSTAVAQLKDSNPDLLIVFAGFGYGPIWQGIQGATWSPKILTVASAFYDGFSAMGPLADSAVVITTHCTTPGHPPFPKALTDPMDGYATVFGTTSTNYILFDTSDNGPLELLKLAIEKNHSTDPDAIKSALESLGDQKLFGTVDYNFTPTNHFGLTGDYGTAVCKMSGFSDGPYRIPVVAP
jgi:ABC-type branched-subunit amino acid transport system substrate-binding protein